MQLGLRLVVYHVSENDVHVHNKNHTSLSQTDKDIVIYILFLIQK